MSLPRDIHANAIRYYRSYSFVILSPSFVVKSNANDINPTI